MFDRRLCPQPWRWSTAGGTEAERRARLEQQQEDLPRGWEFQQDQDALEEAEAARQARKDAMMSEAAQKAKAGPFAGWFGGGKGKKKEGEPVEGDGQEISATFGSGLIGIQLGLRPAAWAQGVSYGSGRDK